MIKSVAHSWALGRMVLAVAIVVTTMCVVNVLDVVDGAPIHNTKKVPPSKEMLSFMKKFGYLSDGGSDSEALYTEDAFREAIREMQSYGGLPETGEINNATLRLMATPRCGVADKIQSDHGNRTKRYVVASKGWKKKRLTYFLANWAQEMDPDDTMRILKKAFKVWSEITPLTFKHVRSMDSDIIVAFARGHHGDGHPFDGNGNILAHAFFPYEHGAYGGDIHFDDDETWVNKEVNNVSEGIDFFTVATHEIGHSLGIAHSRVPNSVMFPYYKGYDTKFRVDYDDILATYDLYVVNKQFEDDVPRSSPDDRRKNSNEDEIDDPLLDDDESEDESRKPTRDEPKPRNKQPRAPTRPPTIQPYIPPKVTTPSHNGHGTKPDVYGRTRPPTIQPYIPPKVTTPSHNGHGTKPDVYGRTRPPTIQPYIPPKVTTPSHNGHGTKPDVYGRTRPPTIQPYIPPKVTTPSHNGHGTKPDVYGRTRPPTIQPYVPPRDKDTHDKKPKTDHSGHEKPKWPRKDRPTVPPEVPRIPIIPPYIPSHKPTEQPRVDERRPTKPDITNGSKIPDICEGSFDSASFVRGELFVFKGPYMWRMQDRGIVVEGYPTHFHHFFTKMPWSVQKIDAMYQRPDQRIVLFSGNQYWIFDGQNLDKDSPQPLRSLGLPRTVNYIDAAFTWGKNGKTYFFRDSVYWRYNEESSKMDNGYPVEINERWGGIPDRVDTAFTWRDGLTYFFKGQHYWRFNNELIQMDENYPRYSTIDWLGCDE